MGRTWTRVLVAGAVVAATAGIGGVAYATVSQPAEPGPAAVVLVDEIGAPDLDRAAALDSARAAKAERERVAAEAEAARIAAEQAAAAEAARIAAEQEAAEEGEADVVDEQSAPEEPVSYCPEGYVDDPARGCHSPICEVRADGTEVPCQF